MMKERKVGLSGDIKMTAEGELYVDEECRDIFEKQLNKEFGKDKWRLDGTPYGYIWNRTQMPPEIAVDVLDIDTDEILGSVVITNKYSQEYDDMQDCMYLNPTPSKLKVTFKKEGNNQKADEEAQDTWKKRS